MMQKDAVLRLRWYSKGKLDDGCITVLTASSTTVSAFEPAALGFDEVTGSASKAAYSATVRRFLHF